MDTYAHQLNDRIRLLAARVAELDGKTEDAEQPAVALDAMTAQVLASNAGEVARAKARVEREIRPTIRAKWEAGETLSEEECRILFGSVPDEGVRCLADLERVQEEAKPKRKAR